MSARKSRAICVSVNYWSAFADATMAMLLLLIFFIFVQFLANSRVLARLMIESRQQEMAVALKSSLGEDAGYMTIVVDGNLQRLRFSDAILFDVGDDTLKEGGKRVLRKVAEQLLMHHDWVSEIQIEGHTDNQPIVRSRFPSNWELSSARATSVVRFFQDSVMLNPARYPLSATGRSEYVPVEAPRADDDPTTVEKVHRKNRRVEIILIYSEKDMAI